MSACSGSAPSLPLRSPCRRFLIHGLTEGRFRFRNHPVRAHRHDHGGGPQVTGPTKLAQDDLPGERGFRLATASSRDLQGTALLGGEADGNDFPANAGSVVAPLSAHPLTYTRMPNGT